MWVLDLKMAVRPMRLEFSRKAASGHLEIIKIPLKTVGWMVWQEISQHGHLGRSLSCKKQIKEEKLDK